MFERIKNLWKLSEYSFENGNLIDGPPPRIFRRKMAVIIKDKEKDIFENERKDTE